MSDNYSSFTTTFPWELWRIGNRFVHHNGTKQEHSFLTLSEVKKNFNKISQTAARWKMQKGQESIVRGFIL